MDVGKPKDYLKGQELYLNYLCKTQPEKLKSEELTD